MPKNVQTLKKDTLFVMRMISKFFVGMEKQYKNGIMRLDYILKNV